MYECYSDLYYWHFKTPRFELRIFPYLFKADHFIRPYKLWRRWTKRHQRDIKAYLYDTFHFHLIWKEDVNQSLNCRIFGVVQKYFPSWAEGFDFFIIIFFIILAFVNPGWSEILLSHQLYLDNPDTKFEGNFGPFMHFLPIW